MGGKRVTLADVARRAGLSASAASMILNGRPDTRLSEESHARVHAAASELGYRPNVAARSLRVQKTQTIGFVSDLVATTRFASGLIKGALAAAEQAGHVVLVAETGGDPARESDAIDALLDRQVDGIVFATMRARELFIPDLPSATRVVLLNATNARYPTSVLPDEYAGGRASVDLLVAAGHRVGIALLGHKFDLADNRFRSTTVDRRLEGIRDAMTDHALEFDQQESVWLWEPDGGFAATERLLAANVGLRVIVCLNDRLAFGAHQALSKHGLRVPEDVALVSFDNDEIAAYLRPGLTTVALPHEAMGARAVELLLQNGESGEVLVPMPVVRRESI